MGLGFRVVLLGSSQGFGKQSMMRFVLGKRRDYYG